MLSSKKMASFLPSSLSAPTLFASSFMVSSGEAAGKHEAASSWPFMAALGSRNTAGIASKQGRLRFATDRGRSAALHLQERRNRNLVRHDPLFIPRIRLSAASELLHPGPQLDLPGPGAAGLMDEVHVAL